MAKVITMPKLGFTQDEGQLVKWYKNVGETASKGELFFDVHTDKSVIGVESTETGTVLKIVVEPGSTVPVFTPLAVVGATGEDADAALKAHVIDVSPDAAVKADFDAETAAEQSCAEEKPADLKLTPKARRLVKEEGYDISSISGIKGTGFEGGITAKDIKASPLAKKIAAAAGTELSTVSGSGVNGKVMKQDVVNAAPTAQGTPEKLIASVAPYAGTRRIIGERLSESKFTAPHMYFTEAVDTTNMTKLRADINALGGVKISVSDILIMAASKALQKYPGINSSLVDDRIETYESTNVGIAVAGSAGLIVPNVKNVQRKTISQVAAETKDLVARAKEGRLAISEYTGGTFTISNLGMFGIENFTAIINPPESAILAVSSVRKKPVVITNAEGEDEIVIRPMMNIQLSFDHRSIDGLLAAQFVEYLKSLLENPLCILL